MPAPSFPPSGHGGKTGSDCRGPDPSSGCGGGGVFGAVLVVVHVAVGRWRPGGLVVVAAGRQGSIDAFFLFFFDNGHGKTHDEVGLPCCLHHLHPPPSIAFFAVCSRLLMVTLSLCAR